MELLEYFFDFFVEIYFEIMLLFIPDDKLNGKNKKLAKRIGIAVILFIFIIFFLGIYLLVDCNNDLGIIAVTIAVILFVAHIVFGIVLNHRKK